MAKTKSKYKTRQVSPLVTAAEQTISNPGVRRQAFIPRWFKERGLDGGMLDNVRMEKIACIRPLEGLARCHLKARRAFLQPHHLMAANAYHADLLALRGQRSHEVREAIDFSADVEAALVYRVEAAQKLSRIQNQMPNEQLNVLDTIFVQRPDHTLARIWPNRSDRDHAKEKIRSALDFLAVEYGLMTG